MQANYDLLYITFIDINEPAKSGSSLRPKKMLEAFEQMQLKIKVLQGANNKRAQRRRNVKEILKWLDSNKPRMCYVEPPSGPFFCSIDLKLLKKLKKMDVPIGLFYRDAYWKYPKIYENINIIKKIKLIIIKQMQLRDLRVFESTCKYIYFPSYKMSELIDIDCNIEVLPPACDVRKNNIAGDIKRLKESKEFTYFYVGAASNSYGVDMLLKCFDNVNAEKIIARLIIVCPKEQWETTFAARYKTKPCWLNVEHLNSEMLCELYKKVDICVIPRPKNEYNDFAVPIKLYEYMSYAKPILATNCTETQRIIQSYDIGWITCDTVDGLEKEILRLYDNYAEIIEKKNNCIDAVKDNMWQKRAEKVVKTLG